MTMNGSVDRAKQAAFVRCRTFGHAWFEADIPMTPRAGRVWRHRFSLQCERCGGVRHDLIDAYGEVDHRYYDMPEGYSYAQDETPTRAEFRLMMFPEDRRSKAPQEQKVPVEV